MGLTSEVSVPAVGEGNIKMTDSGKMNPRLRVLVAIASYGVGHLQYLKEIIQTYRGMNVDVNVVILSEAPKELGPGVEVIVGLPSKNPWTLPFAHKTVFAQRVEQYDLFIYSEDDIKVNETQIRAFLEATSQLAADEIAGFMRYEVDESGQWFVAEPWGHYHWKPESAKRRGNYTIAEFTNEHAGFYILTREQLKRAIASGGFLRGPCRGRYNWPETAATDPYTNCGFRKVICISDLRNFLVHHLPNRWGNGLPVSLVSFTEQIQKLMDISNGIHPASTLCDVESRLLPFNWQKVYYEKPCSELLKMIPAEAETILSVGCGWGATELELKRRGAAVTALPLDSVISEVAASHGIKMIYGTLAEGLNSLKEQRFDCVFMTDLLHLQPNPNQLLEKCSELVQDGGALVIAGPNFARLPWLMKRLLGLGQYGRLRNYASSGISVCGPRTLAKTMANRGLHVASVKWLKHTINCAGLDGLEIPMGMLTAREWVLQARR